MCRCGGGKEIIMAYTDPERKGYSDGEFGSDITPEMGKSRSRIRRKSYGNESFLSVIRSIPWMDIIMILATLAGIIYVAVNFDAVTTSLFRGIAAILPIIIAILIIILIIAGIIMYFSLRRRRRF